MDLENFNEMLLMVLKWLRSHPEVSSEVSAQTEAIYDYVEQRDPDCSESFFKFEREALAALLVPKGLPIQQVDGIIRELESLRKRGPN